LRDFAAGWWTFSLSLLLCLLRFLQPEKFYGSNAAKLAYALEKLLRVTGSTPDLAPAEFRKRLEGEQRPQDVRPCPLTLLVPTELHHERRLMEETTTADPKGSALCWVTELL
jgi:hypothetical protein